MRGLQHPDRFSELQYIDHAMGHSGLGVYQSPAFFTDAESARLSEELIHTAPQAWWDSHETFTNARGVKVQQNFNVLALKLSRGEQTLPEQMPCVMTARKRVEQFIRQLGVVAPILGNWSADELVAQRYDQPLGLSFHRDNARHPGVIAIINTMGRADLEVKTKDGAIFALEQHPGDLTLLRSRFVLPGKQSSWAPEHRVVNVQGDRMSLTFRGNSVPDQSIPGFKYANWSAEPK